MEWSEMEWIWNGYGKWIQNGVIWNGVKGVEWSEMEWMSVLNVYAMILVVYQ